MRLLRRHCGRRGTVPQDLFGDAGLVAQREAGQITGRSGFGSTARLLAGMLQLSAGGASRARPHHAALVGTRRTLIGAILPPLLPATAAVLASADRRGVAASDHRARPR